MTMESIPGFVAWLTEAEAKASGLFTIGGWGIRRVAAFDHELVGPDLGRALDALASLPREYDPVAEAQIEAYHYWEVVADVSKLHLAPTEIQDVAYPLLDPLHTMGGIGLRNMGPSRAYRAFPSEAEARVVLDQLTAIGISCELRAQEGFVVLDGLIIENEDALRNEVARRRLAGQEIPTRRPHGNLLWLRNRCRPG